MNYNLGVSRGPNAGLAQQVTSVLVIARAEAREGVDDEIEELLADFAFDVRNDERGCLSYTVTRAIGSRVHFAVHARFASWRAFERHSLTRHMKRFMPRLNPLLASAVSLEIFLEV